MEIMIEQFNNINVASTNSSGSRLKRNISLRKKFAKKIPLIKKEIENETIYKESIERLIQSIIECNYIKVRNLLEKGTSANIKCNNWSLLHYACSSFIKQSACGTDEHLELIQVLLEYGAKINEKDEDGWTPLHLACQLGVTRLISYLIKKGADRDACTIENLRPIDLVEPDNINAISFLIYKDVDLIEKISI